MTVLSQYFPVSFAVQADQEYFFEFESIGVQALEVYEAIADGSRTLVRHQDYFVELAGKRPQFTGGTVTFNRPHGEDVVTVTIERNTRIDQLLDFKFKNSFNPNLLEFALDKATMIFQEINARKCKVVDGEVAVITQEIVFGDYRPMQSSAINFAFQKLIDIAIEIEAAKEDCRDNPGGT